MNTMQLFPTLEAATEAASTFIANGTDIAIANRWNSMREYLTAKGHTGNILLKAGAKTAMVAATNGTGQVPERVYVPLSNGQDKLWINEKYLTVENGAITGLNDSTVGVATYVKPRPQLDATGKPTGQFYLSHEDYLSGSSANILDVGTLTL